MKMLVYEDNLTTFIQLIGGHQLESEENATNYT